MFSSVARLVHPVANRCVIARIALARANINDVGITGGNRNGANGTDTLFVEDGLEGRAGVGGLDDAAVGARDVVGGGITRHAMHSRDTAGVVGGTNGAPSEPGDGLGDRIFGRNRWRRGDGAWRCLRRQRDDNHGEQQNAECGADHGTNLRSWIKEHR